MNYGIKEGRQGSAEFNVYSHRARYTDLDAAYGDDLEKYYMHYIMYGKIRRKKWRARRHIQ